MPEYQDQYGVLMAGTLVSILPVVILFFVLPWSQWYWAVAAFVGGYVLQFIGHCIEGNDMGEWAGIKRLFGLPYEEVRGRAALAVVDVALAGG